MEIIKNFGLNPVLLAAQVINFLIILYLLKRFLYKPVLTLLKNRQNQIAEGLKKAEESQLLYEKTQKEEKEILKNAQNKAKEILEAAKNEAVELMKTYEENTKKQADKLLAAAAAQIAQDVEMAEKKLVKKIGMMSMELLDKALIGLVDEKSQAEVIKRVAGKMKTQPN